MTIFALHQTLKAERKKRKMTQDQAAALLGCSQKRVSQIESGDIPSMELLEKAAEIYGLEMAKLIELAVKPDGGANELSKDERRLIDAVRAKDTAAAARILQRLLYEK